MNLKEKITNLREDKRGVSPVIGVIMMIAIVVIIAAVVAAFAYGIIGGVNKAPSTALVVEGVSPGDLVDVTLYHHGGDTISDAFNANSTTTGMAGMWDKLEVRVNGAIVTNVVGKNNYATALEMNSTGYNLTIPTWKTTFAPGDQIKIEFNHLDTDDSLIVLHVPSDSILQRVTVS